jgi:hypothetical protein
VVTCAMAPESTCGTPSDCRTPAPRFGWVRLLPQTRCGSPR